MFKAIKNMFKKEEIFPCIVFDGKTMKYLDLTKKQIQEIETLPKYEGWTVTLKSEA